MRRRVLIMISVLMFCSSARADWHTGQVTGTGIGYDGQSVVFNLSGWTRTNCTCYATWPTYMCLDRSRTSFKDEYAWLLTARTVGKKIQVNIDEPTCKVIAVFEDNS